MVHRVRLRSNGEWFAEVLDYNDGENGEDGPDDAGVSEEEYVNHVNRDLDDDRENGEDGPDDAGVTSEVINSF